MAKTGTEIELLWLLRDLCHQLCRTKSGAREYLFSGFIASYAQLIYTLGEFGLVENVTGDNARVVEAEMISSERASLILKKGVS